MQRVQEHHELIRWRFPKPIETFEAMLLDVRLHGIVIVHVDGCGLFGFESFGIVIAQFVFHLDRSLAVQVDRFVVLIYVTHQPILATVPFNECLDDKLVAILVMTVLTIGRAPNIRRVVQKIVDDGKTEILQMHTNLMHAATERSA